MPTSYTPLCLSLVAQTLGAQTVPNPWTGFRIRTPDTEAGNLETGSILIEQLDNRIFIERLEKRI